MIEIIDHTADAGIRVTSPTIEELFIETAWGMLQFVVNGAAEISDCEVEIVVRAQKLENLLIKFLSEILYNVQDRHLQPSVIEILRFKSNKVVVKISGKCDGEIVGEIKSVTYHNFKLEELQSGWLCEIIFDL
jgi:SHS2 domain-containing protein